MKIIVAMCLAMSFATPALSKDEEPAKCLIKADFCKTLYNGRENIKKPKSDLQKQLNAIIYTSLVKVMNDASNACTHPEGEYSKLVTVKLRREPDIDVYFSEPMNADSSCYGVVRD